MKFTFTRFYMLVLAGIGVTLPLSAQVLLWGGPNDPNGTFDGGFNDWTPVGISCSPRPNGQQVPADSATWQWASGNNLRSRGGYFGTLGAFASPTAANGAVFFDSDWLDNRGVGNPNNFGTGQCPSPQIAELISPVIDLSGTQSAAISFYQFYRFNRGSGGATDQPASYVEVTIDGGANWVRFPVNRTVPLNVATPNPTRGLVDITSLAAGQSQVQFKFVWDGSYYFWFIDDVEVSTLPDNNIALTRHFFPPSSVFIPQAFASIDTFNFYARVSNFGGNAVDAVFKVSITNPNNTVTFWADSTIINIPTGTANRVDSLIANYVPNNLPPGEYRIRYELFQPGVTDFDPSDNVRQSAFVITDNSFWQSGVQRTHVRPCFDPACTSTQPWGFGALFPTSESTQEKFKVVTATMQVAGEDNANDLVGKTLDFFLLEILDGEFYGQNTQLGDGTTNIQAAYGDAFLSAANHSTPITLEVFDVDGDGVTPGFELENGKTYYPLLFVGDRVRIGGDNQFNNYPISLADNSVLLKSRLIWDGTFRATFRDWTPYIRLGLQVVSTEDHIALPDASMLIGPNPASGIANVKIDLERTSNITITLADMSGRVIHFENFSGVSQMDYPLNVHNLAPGTYIVRLAAEYGTKTQKLVVVR